ncbi:MAG: alpha-L-fucosidase C-terminal domain-containing protein, partial [Terracidiphilus sp.]
LNVGPKSDGTIPEQARAILLEMGAWLKTNGEAIYGSRPWLVYGEGPTKVAGTAKNSDQQEFTPEDIRFTTHNGALYAIALGWPSNGELRIRSLARGLPYLKGPVCGVKMLGSDASFSWRQEVDGMYIQLPLQRPNEPAWTFRIMEPEGAAHGCGN